MKNGRGVSVYVKENIHSKRQYDLEVTGVEVILSLNKLQKWSLWNFLRANEIWTNIESSIECAVNDIECDQIIVTGEIQKYMIFEQITV